MCSLADDHAAAGVANDSRRRVGVGCSWRAGGWVAWWWTSTTRRCWPSPSSSRSRQSRWTCCYDHHQQQTVREPAGLQQAVAPAAAGTEASRQTAPGLARGGVSVDWPACLTDGLCTLWGALPCWMMARPPSHSSCCCQRRKEEQQPAAPTPGGTPSPPSCPSRPCSSQGGGGGRERRAGDPGRVVRAGDQQDPTARQGRHGQSSASTGRQARGRPAERLVVLVCGVLPSGAGVVVSCGRGPVPGGVAVVSALLRQEHGALLHGLLPPPPPGPLGLLHGSSCWAALRLTQGTTILQPTRQAATMAGVGGGLTVG